jgi:hypothetical protein
MLNFGKYIVLCLFVTLLYSGAAYAQKITLELNANAEDVEAKADVQFPAYEALANIGGGIILSPDDYTIGNIHFIIKDEVFVPALILGLGFKGTIGKVEIHDADFDLDALGFMFMGEYDLRQIYAKIPICIYGDISASPGPLSFSETEDYLDMNAGVRVYIVKQAAVVLGFRHLNTKFENGHEDKKASFDAFFLGLQLNF